MLLQIVSRDIMCLIRFIEPTPLQQKPFEQPGPQWHHSLSQNDTLQCRILMAQCRFAVRQLDCLLKVSQPLQAWSLLKTDLPRLVPQVEHIKDAASESLSHCPRPMADSGRSTAGEALLLSLSLPCCRKAPRLDSATFCACRIGVPAAGNRQSISRKSLSSLSEPTALSWTPSNTSETSAPGRPDRPGEWSPTLDLTLVTAPAGERGSGRWSAVPAVSILPANSSS